MSGQGSLPAKITEWTTVAAASVSVQENTECVCVPIGSVWGKPWVHVLLCSVWMWIRYMDAARRQDCLYFAANKFTAQEVQSEAMQDVEKAKAVPNKNKIKSKFLFTVL